MVSARINISVWVVGNDNTLGTYLLDASCLLLVGAKSVYDEHEATPMHIDQEIIFIDHVAHARRQCNLVTGVQVKWRDI